MYKNPQGIVEFEGCFHVVVVALIIIIFTAMIRPAALLEAK